MSDKRCPHCGACKECGAKPVVVYPWGYWPYVPYVQPYGAYPQKWTVTSSGGNSTVGGTYTQTINTVAA